VHNEHFKIHEVV